MNFTITNDGRNFAMGQPIFFQNLWIIFKVNDDVSVLQKILSLSGVK